MSTTTDDKAATGGITAAERAKLLKELEANPVAEKRRQAKRTPRERVIASLLRERDHLDGCPIIDDPEAAAVAAVEAYEEQTPAPSKALRNQGAVPGGVVVVVRCMTCAGSRYFVSEQPAAVVPVGEGRHVSALIAKTLKEPAAGELDQSL